jgi:LPXTG-site transpeptidase (sortase) family protein
VWRLRPGDGAVPTRALGRGLLVTAVLTGCVLAVVAVGGGTGDHESARPTTPDPSAQAGAAGIGRSTAGRTAAATAAATAPADRQRPSGPVARGRPQQIRIPSLAVRARVVPLETQGRVLVPPSDPTTVGWWRDGARPGARRGAAVLTGHTVSTGGGVFDDLDRLTAGDLVGVTTSRGRMTYVVDDALTIPQSRLAGRAQRLFGTDGPGRLVLVTCEDWNGEVYLSNQVVVAHPS